MHLHAWNVGTQLFLAWVGLQCLFLGINSIIWNHNTINWAPVWCDISFRFGIGISVAIPAVVLCINRRLYILASVDSALHYSAAKRREVIIDLAIGIGLPILEIILAFFAQGSRFMIVEDYGCAAAIFPSWVAIVVVSVPPILLELIAGVYGCLSIHAFCKRRSEMNNILSRHQNLNSNQYLRLMCFSICDLLAGIPITVAYLYFAVKSGLLPYPGFKQEHYHFSDIIQVPAVLWRANTISELSWELNRWIIVWIAFVFFAIFGFTEDSCNNYKAALQAVVCVFRKMTGIKSRSNAIANKITFKTQSTTVNSDKEFSVVYVDRSTISLKQKTEFLARD